MERARNSTANAGVERHSDGADRVVCLGGHLAGAAGPVAIGIDQIVARHWVVVVIVHIVARLRILQAPKQKRLCPESTPRRLRRTKH